MLPRLLTCIWFQICIIVRTYCTHTYSFFCFPGGILDCTAFGVPSPQITWLRLQENSDRIETLEDLLKAKELEANGALWQVLAHNNSLKFRSYSSEDYSSEVHKASYVCKASSESGTILSRSVNVKSGRKILYSI